MGINRNDSHLYLLPQGLGVSQISCKEFLDSKEDEIGMILVWLDGYLSAKSDNTLMDDAWMEKLGKQLGEYCSAHPKKTIMDAVKDGE